MVKRIITAIVLVLLWGNSIYANDEVYIKDCTIVHRNINYYENKVNENPNDVCAHYNLSIEYGKKNKIQNKLDSLYYILLLNPKDEDVYIIRAFTYWFYGNQTEFYREFARAIKYIPDSAIAHKEVSIYYENILDYENALKHINIAIELTEKPDKYLYSQRGDIYKDMEKYEEAAEDFSKVLELDPADDYTYFNRSDCYRKLGKIIEAENDRTTYEKLTENCKYKRNIFKEIRSYCYDIKMRLFYTKILV